MKLSILIPTHNRPNLFTRCLASVLSQAQNNIEIIVNNDTNDITEIDHARVAYHYNQYDSLCEIYKFLLEQAIGEYVYFLEDDDYLIDNFFSKIHLDSDLFVGNYMPMFNTPDKLICSTIYKSALLSPEDFLKNLNEEHLQLSQHIFKRSSIIDFEFPCDSHINNDIKLVKHALGNCNIVRTTSNILFCQTIDGGDNISF